jgi:inhibitor of KinA sporulation pathway (predicted exonuclease)
MKYDKIAFFDLEMCCWENNKKIGEIIEIGLSIVDVEKKEIVKTGQYYVKPQNDTVSDFCTNLTGITPALIKKQGRPLNEVLKSVIKNFGGKNRVYSAWGRDDIVLFNECQSKNIELPFSEFLNLGTVYRLKYNRSNQSTSLQDTLKIHNIEFEGNAHSGLVDSYNLAKLYLALFS